MSKAIGIDLGSTMSSVSIIENGKPTVLVNEEGGYGTPSVISIKGDEIKVGAAAKRTMVLNPTETIRIIKRFMGLTYEEAQEAIKHVQYEIVNKNGKAAVKIGDKIYTPEELSAMILQKMKSIAENYLGETVKDAVITVPAYFSDAARNATKNAGEIAGLNVLRIIAEPTAALLASKIDMKKDAKYLVVDFGGATLDNSVADISDNVVEILASNGDVFLGGSNIDQTLAEWICSEFHKESGIDLTKDVQAFARVLEAAEKAKIELSQSSQTEINLPYITVVDSVPAHLIKTISKAKFEELITPFVDKIISCAKNALTESNVEGKELEGIVLVGGSCRIPLVKERLAKEINENLIMSANLDLAVAEGASLQASILTDEVSSDIVLLDVTPLAYGIETLGGAMTTLVEANTTIPCKKEEVFTTAQDNQTAVTIRVLQGNRPLAKDNQEVGIFNLDGIVPARRGVPQISVSFDIDVNGILTVSATDKGTGKEQHITIQSNGGLSKEEIERMKAEAEANAEADKKARETVDTLNKAESMIFSNEKMVEDMKDKLSEEDKSAITTLIEDMKKALEEKNVDKIGEIEKNINEKWNSISEKMYAQAQAQPQTENEQTTENSSTDSTDGVQDANFEEVK